MRLFSNLVLALYLTLSFISPSFGHAHQGRRHHVHGPGDLARRDPGEIQLHKRFDNVRLTFYAVGLGACGQTNAPSDFIVALNSAQYTSGDYCFQTITITVNGKSAQALIMDECPGCPFAGLDLSLGLFEFFADVSVGVLTGTWNFGSGGSPPSPSTPPPPTPTPTTPTPTPTPTTTSTPPSSSSSTSSSSSQSSSSSGSSSSSSSVAPTPSNVSVTVGVTINSSVLGGLNDAIVFIGGFLSACSGSQ